MTGSKNSAFSNEDSVVATGLAFAGMAVLQSKLLPELGRLGLPGLNGVIAARAIEWWPVLLIIAGVWLWIRSSSETRRNQTSLSSEGGK